MREWLEIGDSRKDTVFSTGEQQKPRGYIPRDVAEGLLGRKIEGAGQWLTVEEGRLLRAHPEWRRP